MYVIKQTDIGKRKTATDKWLGRLGPPTSYVFGFTDIRHVNTIRHLLENHRYSIFYTENHGVALLKKHNPVNGDGIYYIDVVNDAKFESLPATYPKNSDTLILPAIVSK
jgi:hypothetical protein